MFRTAAVALFLATGPAMADDLSGVWTLTAIDGAEVAFATTLDLTEPGKLTGKAPCNNYSGKLSVAADSFLPGPILSTKMACDGMAEEAAYLQALQMVDTVALDGDRLTLTGEQELVFTRRPD
jgi:heat shock protein HslJ